MTNRSQKKKTVAESTSGELETLVVESKQPEGLVVYSTNSPRI